LTRQFYLERGIEYIDDYHDYLVDYDRWADWFKAQKSEKSKGIQPTKTLRKELSKIIAIKRNILL